MKTRPEPRAKTALLLIDLQSDYLDNPLLQPPKGQVVARAAALLEGARRAAIDVVHVWTTVERPDKDHLENGPDERMPHWKTAGRWSCVAGTAGHAPPPLLTPLPGEMVFHKRFFSAFEGVELDVWLQSRGIEALLIAGVHSHACVRASVTDAYRRGLDVVVVEDACGSDDPLHAAISNRYLRARAARFVSVVEALASVANPTVARDESMRHFSPRDGSELWQMAPGDAAEVEKASYAAFEAQKAWQERDFGARRQLLTRIGEVLGAQTEFLAREMADQIGKPVSQGRAEIARGVALIEAARTAPEPCDTLLSDGSRLTSRPLGVVAAITPWNNPVAIALGKIAPALFYGNAVVWKPAPAATQIARHLTEILRGAGCPRDLVAVVAGDAQTAEILVDDPRIGAVTFSGSEAAGWAISERCARRHAPLQAELGGNNAALVWQGADLGRAALQIASGAFGFAGQRCTANRRVVVDEKCYAAFVTHLKEAAASLVWDDPREAATQIGPLISQAAHERVTALIERARTDGHEVWQAHDALLKSATWAPKGAYLAPTLIFCDDCAHEIVQEESFGPVLVVQRAPDFEMGLQLCNGVRQGLVAALFSNSDALKTRFLAGANAGILKINSTTADAGVLAPFGGWKASGFGPPEHGAGNSLFYTRWQSVYGAAEKS